MNEQAEERVRRKIPVKLIVVIAAVLIFAVGMAVEVYKHSDSRMKSLLDNNRQCFETCAEFFGIGGGAASVTVTDKDIEDENSTADINKKRSVYTSAQFLAEKYRDYPVSRDIESLSDAGVQKISLVGYEVRFYTDIDSGLCYISPESQSEKNFYYPEGYLDENRIDGDWYRFGKDVKK